MSDRAKAVYAEREAIRLVAAEDRASEAAAAVMHEARRTFVGLSPAQRLRFLEVITEGYCTLCAEPGPCFCSPAYDD